MKMDRPAIRLARVLSLVMMSAACSTPEVESVQTVDPTLQVATALGVPNAAMPIPGLVVGGQLTREQIDSLSGAGIESFISLRGPDEPGAGWEEAHTTERSISFQRLHIAGAADLSQENAEALAEMLEAAGENTVLYCASGNRAGSLLALKAFFVDGVSSEEAIELGRAAGMTRLEERVRAVMADAEN